MSFCTNCGFKLKEGDIYCSNCGLKVRSDLSELNADYDDDFDEDDEMERTIFLDDENGNTVKFLFLDYFEYQGRNFTVLAPMDEQKDSGEVCILEVITDSRGKETFINPDDMKLLNKVFEEFKVRNKDNYNFL